MTPPALMWKTYDATIAPAGCSYPGCPAVPAVMRGPRTTRLRLPWRGYCPAHASLYGMVRASWRAS